MPHLSPCSPCLQIQLPSPISIADHLLSSLIPTRAGRSPFPTSLPTHPQQSREIFSSRFTPHSSRRPNLQLQQASPGNILGEPGREASGPVKPVPELLVVTFPPSLPINPSLSYSRLHRTASWGCFPLSAPIPRTKQLISETPVPIKGHADSWDLA